MYNYGIFLLLLYSATVLEWIPPVKYIRPVETSTVWCSRSSARNGYPGRYPVRTRVPGNFYYPVAVHSTFSFRLRIWCNWQHISQVHCKFMRKLQV